MKIIDVLRPANKALGRFTSRPLDYSCTFYVWRWKFDFLHVFPTSLEKSPVTLWTLQLPVTTGKRNYYILIFSLLIDVKSDLKRRATLNLRFTPDLTLTQLFSVDFIENYKNFNGLKWLRQNYSNLLHEMLQFNYMFSHSYLNYWQNIV